jgi:hypothetical protein
MKGHKPDHRQEMSDRLAYLDPPPPRPGRPTISNWLVAVSVVFALFVVLLGIGCMDYFGYNIVGYTISFAICAVILLPGFMVISLFMRDR